MERSQPRAAVVAATGSDEWVSDVREAEPVSRSAGPITDLRYNLPYRRVRHVPFRRSPCQWVPHPPVVLSIQPLGPQTLHEFSPVSQARSILLTIPEVLTKSHVVIFFIKSLHYLLASSSHSCLTLPAYQLGLISHLRVSR